MAADRLTTSLLAAYAAPALPLAALTLPVYIYLPSYYADDLGLGLGVVGAILLLARLWDVVSDPLIGWLSDHGNGRAAGWRRHHGSVALEHGPLSRLDHDDPTAHGALGGTVAWIRA